MILTKPSYYDNFTCLAGRCPDTCCGNWAVVIDPESLAFYQSVEGELGETIRGALELDGEPCFRLNKTLCRLLAPDGLCLIQRELGEERLCRNCASYPRFSTEIGQSREIGLSLSCPEAARLILIAEAPFAVCTERTDEPPAVHELSPELILTLRQLRTQALDIARDRTLPFSQRCAGVLSLCAPLARPCRDRALDAALREGIERARNCAAPAGPGGVAHLFSVLHRTLEGLEALRPEWHDRVCTAAERCAPGAWGDAGLPHAWEQLLCYGIYKYFPRAAFDRAVWPAAVFCVTLPLLVRQLMATSEESMLRAAWNVSRELEHSEQNMAALFRAFSKRDFRPAAVTGVFAAFGE